MEEIVPLFVSDKTQVEPDPLTTIIAAVTQVLSNYPDVTWMAQPTEKAVYIHATEYKSFAAITIHLQDLTTSINQVRHTNGEVGIYRCEPDHDRHCLDIFYSRY